MMTEIYFLYLTSELLYGSDIMTDTENDCKQKKSRYKSLASRIFSLLFAPFVTATGLWSILDRRTYKTPASVQSGSDHPEL